MKYFYAIIISVFLGSCSQDQKTLFTKIDSSKTGIDFNNKITETEEFNVLTDEYIFNGGGVATADFNNDGLMDLFFTGNQVSNKLYLNKGDLTFEDVTDQAGLNSSDFWSTGIAIADVNADGLEDIFVCASMYEGKKANKLYINQGIVEDKPSFQEMSAEYGLTNDKNSMGALFFDYNNDGLLDLYVLNNEQHQFNPTNYREKIIDGSALNTDQLYKNTGNGFEDVSQEAGITIEGYGLGIAALDINNDGYTDLYVSNDYIANDVLYVNQGDGTFKNEFSTYLKHQSKFSMGNDVSDFNNDGISDIITTDMLGETHFRKKTTIGKTDYLDNILNDKYNYEYQNSRNMLHKGNSDGVPYSEIGMMAGVYQTDWSWSPLFVDADNDGYRDLFITNGFPRDITDLDFISYKFEYERYASHEILLDSMPSVKIPNYVFKNQDSYQFQNTTKEWGLNTPSFSNGAIFVDLDNDGDMDYVVNNINDEAFVYQNNTVSKNKPLNSHYLQLHLIGPAENINGIGTKIQLKSASGKQQFHQQYLTRGFMSSVDPKVQFGLGNETLVNSLEVVWPDGKKQTLTNINADQLIQVNYKDARLADSIVKEKSKTIFNEVATNASINYVHTESDFDDYNYQRLLGHKISQSGPCVATADVNGDGLEDFIIGSSDQNYPSVYYQSKDGSFKAAELFTDENYLSSTEECIRPIDIENDGDIDFIVTAKGKNYQNQENYIAINDSKGHFTIKNMNEQFTGSIIAVGDFNADGYDDVFVGGGANLKNYPHANPSKLLINHAGVLMDSKNAIIKDIDQMGIVTDAKWVDLNQDSYMDLVVVGEFEPIKIYMHSMDGLDRVETNIDQYKGLWSSIIAFDNDGDGDLDLMAGNIGPNNYMHLSPEHPITLVAEDLDKNGSVDPILFVYEKDKDSIFKPFPYNFRDNLIEQSPIFRRQFKLYKNFAKTEMRDFFDKTTLAEAFKLEANFELSVYIENLGNNQFKMYALPSEAQIAPITDMKATDFNQDGYTDVILVGNDFRYESFVGRLDASNGLLLQGTGSEKFIALDAAQSGIVIPKDGREISSIKTSDGKENFLVTQNRDQLLLFSKN